MTLVMIQKLIASMVIQTTFFLILIFIAYHDLMRRISNSIWQLLPGIGLFALGVGVSISLKQPDFIFAHLFPIKSGFARAIIGSSILPVISAATRTMTIIGSLTLLIDKMWYYWRLKRIPFLIRMQGVVFMIIVAGNTTFRVIFHDPAKLIKGVQKINMVGAWAATILGTILLLTTIMAIPYIFGKKRELQEK